MKLRCGGFPHEQLHQEAIQRVVEVSSIEATQSLSAQSCFLRSLVNGGNPRNATSRFATLVHSHRSRSGEVWCRASPKSSSPTTGNASALRGVSLMNNFTKTRYSALWRFSPLKRHRACRLKIASYEVWSTGATPATQLRASQRWRIRAVQEAMNCCATTPFASDVSSPKSTRERYLSDRY